MLAICDGDRFFRWLSMLSLVSEPAEAPKNCNLTCTQVLFQGNDYFQKYYLCPQFEWKYPSKPRRRAIGARDWGAANLRFMMSEKAKHLATFQNLCVIAYADGELHREERAMLEEMAEGMGLSPEDIRPILAQGGSLGFVIPQTEADCYMELRMVVLMMLTDGQLSPSEYEGCCRLSEQMGIDRRYLDETIDFYREKQKERLKHLGIFQNLYLIAAADGYIDPQEQQLLLEVARNLGLSQRDINHVLDHPEGLDFVIPDEEEERYFSLKNLVYMMVVDGKVDQKEYDLCLDFAQRIGMGEDEIEAIISEYEAMQAERAAQQDDVEETNLNTYLEVYHAFTQIDYPVEQWLDLIKHIQETGRILLPDHLDGDSQLAFHRLLWLIYVRSYQLSDEAEVMIPLHLDLCRAKGSLHDLVDYLIKHERDHGAQPISLMDLSAAQVLQDLQERFNQWS